VLDGQTLAGTLKPGKATVAPFNNAGKPGDRAG
jgi:hypothetical protein